MSSESDIFNELLKWMGGASNDSSSEQNFYETIINKFGMNVNDLCEQIAKSNLSSFHPVDVIEHDSRVEVWIDVPGFNKEDLEVVIKEDCLTISGSLRDPRPRRMYMKERSAPNFKRAIKLPTRVTVAGCKSVLEQGVLQLSLSKIVPDAGTRVPL